MSTKVDVLMARRKALVLQAAQQREILSCECHQLIQPFRVADTVLKLAGIFKRKLWLVTLGTTLIGALGFPKLTIPGKVSSFWNAAKGAFNLWQKIKQS